MKSTDSYHKNSWGQAQWLTMPQTVLGILQYWPSAPEVSVVPHTRYSTGSGSSGRKSDWNSKNTTTTHQIGCEHSRACCSWWTTTEHWLTLLCGRYCSHGEIWAWWVTRGRYSYYAEYTAIPLTTVHHRGMSRIKLAALGTACSIDLTEQRSEQQQNLAKELKERSLCWALCCTGPMAKCVSLNLVWIHLWTCHSFEGNVNISWLRYTQRTKRCHFSHFSHPGAHMIWEICIFLTQLFLMGITICPTRQSCGTRMSGQLSLLYMFAETSLWN